MIFVGVIYGSRKQLELKQVFLSLFVLLLSVLADSGKWWTSSCCDSYTDIHLAKKKRKKKNLSGGH